MPQTPTASDGIHAPMPPQNRTLAAQKLWDTYEKKPGAPFFRKTFGLWMCLDTWYKDGLDRDTDLDAFFAFDPPGHHTLGRLGWCEAEFFPAFEEKIIQDLGDKEVVQDIAGRHVLYFKGRRHGFMPEYLDHPVKDQRSWEEQVKWRLDPYTRDRNAGLSSRMCEAQAAAARGLMMQQNLIGGYMYLRSLMGPEHLLTNFYDKPDLIHDCMQTWLTLSDAVIATHQKYVTIDEVYLAEDICYNSGPLISPEMIERFLFPYYQHLITNIKSRQLDRSRHLYGRFWMIGLAAVG